VGPRGGLDVVAKEISRRAEHKTYDANTKNGGTTIIHAGTARELFALAPTVTSLCASTYKLTRKLTEATLN
jgi:hypothetical protein